MKVIGFHSNQLGLRGTEVALYDYAFYNEQLLNNKSIIISNSKAADLQSLEKFKSKFEVFLYNDFSDCEKFAEKHNIDFTYFIKSGENDGKILKNTKNLIHAVFQNKDPHGDRYAYVSKWLASQMGMEESYVPHIVDLPTPNKNYRKKLNIPDTAIVVGRYGGINDFDLPFVWEAVYNTANTRNDVYFLFMSTAQFCSPKTNIIFTESTYNLQHKSNFINTCDYMIHARSHGESFGLSVAEFLSQGKPIISWIGGLDKNHHYMLGNEGIWYDNYDSLFGILTNVQKPTKSPDVYKKLVKDFTPKHVMQRFDDIFLS
jgi:hypothetical protein